MANLTVNQKTFIERMKEDEEFERRGFELLLKREDFFDFFDDLEDAGLFSPSRNQGPVGASTPGYYTLPYWQPLSYLEATAKLSGERRDIALAQKVMAIVRKVSGWTDASGAIRDNQNTWRSFAKILGLVPSEVVSLDDIDLVKNWLASGRDRSASGYEFANSTVKKFVGSNRAEDWSKAARLLFHCTALVKPSRNGTTQKTRDRARTAVDDYWLKEIISSSAGDLGRLIGREICDVFRLRATEVFQQEFEGKWTALFRPAVEDHAQNRDWYGPENHAVEGLRNALLAWINADTANALPYVDEMLRSNIEIVERIAIYAIDRSFGMTSSYVGKAINARFFNSGHLHELYALLKNHFATFSELEKNTVVEAIRNLPAPDHDEDSTRVLRHTQRKWLSAIEGQGFLPADALLEQLKNEPGYQPIGSHPDFSSYHETRWGFGPTPYTTEELIAFAESGRIVEQLNSFSPTGGWNGPTVRSLTETVIGAICQAPLVFLSQMQNFREAKPAYQYATLEGFKRLWAGWDGKVQTINWNDTWIRIFDLSESIVGDEKFWAASASEEHDFSPSKDWISPVISELIKAGVQDDSKVFAPELLTRTWNLLNLLLEKQAPSEAMGDGDALTYAINTSRGKALEAAIDHALRQCRLSDKEHHSHDVTWSKIQPTFDKEIAACRDSNFVFSALAGAYAPNFQYMSQQWLHENFGKIFTLEYPRNCLAALDGFAYAPATMPIYEELKELNVIEWALAQKLKGDYTREKVIERVSLAYLWNQDALDSPRFCSLFDKAGVGGLETVSRFFWRVRGESLSEDQKNKVFLFWEKCVDWCTSVDPEPTGLLSELSLLSCYVESVGTRELHLLKTVAPHTSVGYHSDMFIAELSRIVDESPAEIGEVLTTLLQNYSPDYDLEDRLKNVILKLAEHGEARQYAIKASNYLRSLPGMLDVYKELIAAS